MRKLKDIRRGVREEMRLTFTTSPPWASIQEHMAPKYSLTTQLMCLTREREREI